MKIMITESVTMKSVKTKRMNVTSGNVKSGNVKTVILINPTRPLDGLLSSGPRVTSRKTLGLPAPWQGFPIPIAASISRFDGQACRARPEPTDITLARFIEPAFFWPV